MDAPPASELTGPNALATTTVVTGSSSSGGNVPSGSISMYVNATAPTGWVKCDGSAISRSTFASLFAVIGTTYGSGDGSTTFNVPDMQGRVPVGQGTNASVSSLNANDGQTLANRRPHHRTSISEPSHVHGITNVSDIPNSGIANAQGDQVSPTQGPSAGGSGTIGITVGTGVANDALDTPSFIVLLFIIKT